MSPSKPAAKHPPRPRERRGPCRTPSIPRQPFPSAILTYGVVGDDDGLGAGDTADGGDEPAGGDVLGAVEREAGERGNLQQRRAGVAEARHALAGEQLALGRVPCACRVAAAEGDARKGAAQVGGERPILWHSFMRLVQAQLNSWGH
jgi:hypothetical protein